MTAQFDARAWVEAWRSAGGGWYAPEGKLGLLEPVPSPAQIERLASMIRGNPERVAAVKAIISPMFGGEVVPG